MSYYREQARFNFPPSFHSFSSLDGSLLCRMDTQSGVYTIKIPIITQTRFTPKKI